MSVLKCYCDCIGDTMSVDVRVKTQYGQRRFCCSSRPVFAIAKRSVDIVRSVIRAGQETAK